MQTLAHHDSWSTTGPGLPMNKIRVLIVDQHMAVRRALAARLSSFSRIDVVATAHNLEEGLERAQATRPDVVLLELKGSSPDANPVRDMCDVLSGHPAGVIVLTSYAEDDERERAFQAGARRYLLKHIDTTRLLAEIEAVAKENPSQDQQ